MLEIDGPLCSKILAEYYMHVSFFGYSYILTSDLPLK